MSVSSLASALLCELNECRSNPPLYSSKLTSLLPLLTGPIMSRPEGGDLRRHEGAGAVTECVEVLIRTPPLPLFRLSTGMCRAAQSLCDESGPVGHFDHTGPSGSTMASRLSRFGRWVGGCGESLSSGCEDARGIVLQLLVDDGVPLRRHRENLLNPNFTQLGVGAGPHKKYRYMCALYFANDFQDTVSMSKVRLSPQVYQPTKHKKDSAGHKLGAVSGPKAIARSHISGAMMSQLDPDFPESQREWPPGAVGFHSNTSITTKDGRKVTKVVKTYKMADGSQITKESTSIN